MKLQREISGLNQVSSSGQYHAAEAPPAARVAAAHLSAHRRLLLRHRLSPVLRQLRHGSQPTSARSESSASDEPVACRAATV